MPFDFNAVKDFLRCPECGAELVQDGDHLICTNADKRSSFPIKDGIPVLLVDEASELSPEEWSSIVKDAGRS